MRSAVARLFAATAGRSETPAGDHVEEVAALPPRSAQPHLLDADPRRSPKPGVGAHPRLRPSSKVVRARRKDTPTDAWRHRSGNSKACCKRRWERPRKPGFLEAAFRARLPFAPPFAGLSLSGRDVAVAGVDEAEDLVGDQPGGREAQQPGAKLPPPVCVARRRSRSRPARRSRSQPWSRRSRSSRRRRRGRRGR